MLQAGVSVGKSSQVRAFVPDDLMLMVFGCRHAQLVLVNSAGPLSTAAIAGIVPEINKHELNMRWSGFCRGNAMTQL